MIAFPTESLRRALSVLVLLMPLQARAQASADTQERDSAAIRNLRSAATASPAEAAILVLADAGPEGFGLRSSDGAFRLRFRGLAHYDGRAFVDDDGDRSVSGFDVRRVRADLRGTIYSDYDFRLNLDYAGNRAEVLDAYLEGRFSPLLQIRVGKFKAPVGLERMQSVSALIFAERGFPTTLVPNRDVGVQLQGVIGGSRLSYAVGIFNGVPDGGSGDSDASDNKDFAARLFLQPFLGGPAALQGLGIGIAGTIGEQIGSPGSSGLPAFRTTIGRTTFLRFRDDTEEGSAALDGRRTRITPQGYWYWGPVGLLAEYVRSTSEIRIGEESDQLTSDAWQMTGSWVLTGEDASYSSVIPSRPLRQGPGGWGALELAGRVQGIESDRAAFPLFASPSGAAAKATAYTLGVNWYLNRFVRLQADWEHTRFEAADPAAALADEDVLITRVQLAF